MGIEVSFGDHVVEAAFEDNEVLEGVQDEIRVRDEGQACAAGLVRARPPRKSGVDERIVPRSSGPYVDHAVVGCSGVETERKLGGELRNHAIRVAAAKKDEVRGAEISGFDFSVGHDREADE